MNLKLLALLFSLFPSLAYGCSCTGPDFVEFAVGSPLLVRATITDVDHNAEPYPKMQIKITEVLKGELEHSSIVILGDPGYSCHGAVHSNFFPNGSDHLFILSSTSERQFLIGCGESHLKIVGNTLVSRRRENSNPELLEDLLSVIRE